jgi:hypothetical protein
MDDIVDLEIEKVDAILAKIQNDPEPEEIKKKYKIKDGGENYLIFSQSQRNKHILKAKLL